MHFISLLLPEPVRGNYYISHSDSPWNLLADMTRNLATCFSQIWPTVTNNITGEASLLCPAGGGRNLSITDHCNKTLERLNKILLPPDYWLRVFFCWRFWSWLPATIVADDRGITMSACRAGPNPWIRYWLRFCRSLLTTIKGWNPLRLEWLYDSFWKRVSGYDFRAFHDRDTPHTSKSFFFYVHIAYVMARWL